MRTLTVYVVSPSAAADEVRLIEVTEESLCAHVIAQRWAAGSALAEWMSQNASASFMDGFFETYKERHPHRFE